MDNKIFILFMIITLLFFASCGSVAPGTKIKNVTQNPNEYRDETVIVTGKVVETIAIPLVNKGVYKIDDGSDQIWVRPARHVPYRGEEVTVTGELKIGLTIAGKNFGLILVEKGDEEE